MKKAKRLIVVAIVLCLVSAVGASLLQTGGGAVAVTETTIPGSDGATISGLLYRPQNATADNPLPLIITGHGSFNNKEMQDQNLIELSRRGFVVFAPDSYRHGKSSIHSEDMGEYTSMVDSVEALRSLNYVDQARIGLMGHSMGGDQANNTVRHYIEQEARGEGENPISAVLTVGCDPPYTFYETEGIAEPVPVTVDYGVIQAKYDEWFFKQPDVDMNPARYLESENAQSFVNQVGAGLTGPVESGQIYEGTIGGEDFSRVIYQTEEIHPANHFSRASAAAAVDFFYDAFGVPSGYAMIDANNQIWFAKEFFNLLGLVGFFMFLLPFTYILLQTKFFGEVVSADSAVAAPKPAAPQGKLGFWVVTLVNMALPALLYIPIGFKLIGQETFVPAIYNRVFGEANTNELAGWSLFVAAAILLVLLAYYYLVGKKRGASIENWGVKTSARGFFKALLAAAITVFAAYMVLFILNFFFGTDFRFWVLGVKTFGADKLLYALVYIPAFVCFYLVNSVTTNMNANLTGWKEWQVLLLSCLSNILGLVILVIIQYTGIMRDGTEAFNAMRIVNLFPLLVLIPLGTIITRRYFKATQNIYTGSFVIGILYAVIISANTMFTASLAG